MNFTLVGPVYPYRGGIAHHTALLSQALQNAGHQVQVISFHSQYPGFLYPGKTDKDPSLDPLHVLAEYPLHPFLPWTWLHALRSVRKFLPDLLVIQWWNSFWSLPFAFLAHQARKAGIPVSFLIHNVLPHEPHFWDPWLTKLALSGADICIIQSPREEGRLKELIPSAKYRLAPLPIYSFPVDKLAATKLSKSSARHKLNLPQEPTILLHFGIVRPYKGLHILLQALGILKGRGCLVYLVVAGEFWEPVEKYHDLIRELELQDLVRVENRYIPNEELDLYFVACDALVAPYPGGTQSAVTRLGLGYGMPIIATDRALTGIDLSHQPNIWQVPAEDATALSAAILEFLTSPPEKRARYQAKDDWPILVELCELLARDLR